MTLPFLTGCRTTRHRPGGRMALAGAGALLAKEAGLRQAHAARPRAGRDLLGVELPGGIGEEIEKDRAVECSPPPAVHPVPEVSGTGFPGTGWLRSRQRTSRNSGISPEPRPDALRRGLEKIPAPDSPLLPLFLSSSTAPCACWASPSPSPPDPNTPLDPDAAANPGAPADGVQNATVVRCNYWSSK